MFLFILLVSTAIFCYQCNSEYDPRCADPFDAFSLGVVNCSLKPRLEHMPEYEPILCRKTKQKSKLIIIMKRTLHLSCKFFSFYLLPNYFLYIKWKGKYSATVYGTRYPLRSTTKSLNLSSKFLLRKFRIDLKF